MATAKKPTRVLATLTERQKASLSMAEALVHGISYDLLNKGDGEAAASIARRATEIVDATIARAA